MIHSLLVIGSCLAAIYGVVLFLYSGLRFSFLVTWGFVSGLLLSCAMGVQAYQRNPKRFPPWFPVSFMTTICAAIMIFMIAELLIFVGASAPETKNLDYVIVLGAKVNDNGVSNSLKKRLDRAVRYMNESPETILVLSGGKGVDEPVSEALAMYQYLIEQGISEHQMIMENHSTNTTENISFSKLLIEQDQSKRKEERKGSLMLVAPGPFIVVEDKPLRVGILTSDFHLFRSKQIAKKSGIEDIGHVKADSDLIMLPHLCIRECFAILKDQFMGNM